MKQTTFPFGQSTGPLYDKYATQWFIRVAEMLETNVKAYIELHGEPEDWMKFHIKKAGNLGLEMSIHTIKQGKGDILYKFFISINKFVYETWARDHLYLMESILTFRVGPIIFAHPGRPPGTIKIGGNKKHPRPNSIWTMKQGFLQKGGSQWFNLIKEEIVIDVERTTYIHKPNKPAWMVTRTK